jgi:hypothetical protein
MKIKMKKIRFCRVWRDSQEEGIEILIEEVESVDFA